MQQTLVQKINAAKAEFDLNSKIVSQKSQDLEQYKERLKLVEHCQGICQRVAEQTQRQLSVQLDSLVDLALETLFPGQYKFHLDFDTLRGKTEVQFTLVDLNTGKVLDDIVNEFGGGLTDLVTWGLRVCLWSLGSTDNVIVLDEPFKFLSRDMRAKAGELLREISEKLNLQFILVSHVPELIDSANKVFTVTQTKGVSEVGTCFHKRLLKLIDLF